MARWVRLVAWFLCFMVATPYALQANRETISPPPDERVTTIPPLFGFAAALFEAGEYYRAIGEFQRFLFFQAEHPLATEAQFTIGLAYFCGELWLQASEVFRAVARVAEDSRLKQEATLWMAESRAQGGDDATASRLYQEVISQYPGTAVAERAAYLIGWSLMRQRQWDAARQALDSMEARSFYADSSRRLAAALDAVPSLPKRSPAVARILATVLPGTGQIYTGHTLDGLIGFGVHAALIAGAIGAVSAGLEAATAVSAFFTWGFYSTQMSNAATSAHEFNAQVEDRFIGQLAAQERRFLRTYLRPLPCAPSPSLAIRSP